MSLSASDLFSLPIAPGVGSYRDWNNFDGDEIDYDDDDDDEDDGDEGALFRTNNGNAAVVATGGSSSGNMGGPSTNHSGVISGGVTLAPSLSAETARHANRAAAQPRDHLLDRYRDVLNVDSLEASRMEGVTRHTGRDDRATVEQVMDPRTRLVLFRLLAAGFISAVNGCVSTGKEANVYYAERPGGAGPVALKIYKTSVLVFKDRDRYVTGEFRFKSGYARGNPRKMVKLWAEKEMRNLKRLHAAGLRVPAPLLLRLHVLAMDFLGIDGWPSPRLKDAAPGLTPSRLAEAYIEVADAMRAMFQKCGLVHGDLSEYNMLWHGGGIAIIDVSQSVESDHPRALDFLRIDAQNVTDFFRRSGVPTMSTRELFDYVVHATLQTRADEEVYLDVMRQRADERAARGEAADADDAPRAASGGADDKGKNSIVDEAVFLASYIPRSLHGVRDVEGDVAKVRAGETGGLYYGALMGLVSKTEAASGGGGGGGEQVVEEEDALVVNSGAVGDTSNLSICDDDDDDSNHSSSSGSDLEEESGGGGGGGVYARRGVSKEEHKAFKIAAKAAARERRTKKVKKNKKRSVAIKSIAASVAGGGGGGGKGKGVVVAS